MQISRSSHSFQPTACEADRAFRGPFPYCYGAFTINPASMDAGYKNR
jgi:hypothetical protein